MGPERSTGHPTRRRSGGGPRAADRILATAVRLVTEDGVRSATMEAIATEAGVGKQTLYRWWPNRAALLIDAHLALADRELPRPTTGHLVGDVEHLVAGLARVLADGTGGAMCSAILLDGQAEPELLDSFRSEFIAPRRQLLVDALADAATRSELAADVDVELLADALYGPLWYALLVRGRPMRPADARRHARQVLDGVT